MFASYPMIWDFHDDNPGYTIGCPIGCLGSLISQHKHILVMFEEPEEYDRYHRFATEECLLQGIQSQNGFVWSH